MTANRRPEMRVSKPHIVIWLAAAALLLLMAPSLVSADDQFETTQLKHVIDSYSDRTPARTAFPEYPRIARRDRIEGDATVCFLIDKRGRIRKARIRHVTHPIFKRAALRAIRASSFEPLAPNQVLATARTCRTYRFRLAPVVASNTPESS